MCGMGAGKDTETCANIIKDPVMSVGELALNIATLGSLEAATSTAKVNSGKLTELQKAWDAIKNKPAVKAATDAYDAASKQQAGYESVEQLYVADGSGLLSLGGNDCLDLGPNRCGGGDCGVRVRQVQQRGEQHGVSGAGTRVHENGDYKSYDPTSQGSSSK